MNLLSALVLALLAAVAAATANNTLPILHLEDKGGQYFDYPVEIGSPPQQLLLRVDVLQGDVWVPDAAYFTPCSVLIDTGSQTLAAVASSSDADNNNTTTSSTSTTSATTTAALMTRSPSSKAKSRASASGSVAVSALQTQQTSSHTNLCAPGGVYVDYGSLYSGFISILDKIFEVYDSATTYSQTYLSSIFVKGIWTADSMNLQVQFDDQTADVRLWDVPFVVANASNVQFGALALGISQELQNPDTNFISNFVNNNLIKSNSYSLALSANNGTDPQVILGGVVKDLLTNYGLQVFEFLPVFNQIGSDLSNTSPAFPIFGWGVTSGSTGQSVMFSETYNDRLEVASYPKPALLDSRHSYNYIPYSTLVEMAIELNAYYSSDLDLWVTDCSIGDIGTIDMYLADNFTIKMPISKFISPISVNSTGLVFQNGNSACALAFLPDYRLGYSLMGTPFIKSAYVAVDNENKVLGLGNLKTLLSDNNLGQISVDNSTETTESFDDSVAVSSDVIPTLLSSSSISTTETTELEVTVTPTSASEDGTTTTFNRYFGGDSTTETEKKHEIVITSEPSIEKRDTVIGGSTSELIVTKSGRVLTRNGQTLTDYGYIFTESYQKPGGPNLIASTFTDGDDNTITLTVTNRDKTVMITAVTTLTSESYQLASGATSTSYSLYVPITSGTIPFGTTYTYQPMTLTKPASVSFTDTLAVGTNVLISGGEVVFETRISSERDTTFYAFSSLVTSITAHSAGANDLSLPSGMSWAWCILGLLYLI